MQLTQIAMLRSSFIAMGVALSVIFLGAAAVAPAASEVSGKDSSGFVEKMKKWQDAMSAQFRDAYRSLHGESKQTGKPVATASVDLREQSDSYLARLNLPNRKLDDVEVKLDGQELHIVAPAESGAGRYEQTIVLNGIAPDAKPQIERKLKDNLIVVTVPKPASTAQASPSPFIPDPALAPLKDWDRDVIARMERMRREMDRIFNESFQEFRLTPEHKGFFDQSRFGSSIDLHEEGDHYVVRAYLPDRDVKNVNVKIEGRTLTIEANAEDTNRQEGAVVSQAEHYSQLFTLPGPVQSDKMEVDRKQGMVVVTLPKAQTK